MSVRRPVRLGRPALNKYGARRVKVGDQVFASGAEAARYRQLLLLERAGAISGLVLQPSWVFEVNGVRIGRYTADFMYREHGAGIVVEDVKSTATRRARDYPLRKKLLRALFGIEVTEILK